MKLYPRLRLETANRLAEEFVTLSSEQLRERSVLVHSEAFFAPTGGDRVTPAHLNHLRSGLEDIAQRNANSASEFDYEAAVFLFENMEIDPVEAARQEVWSCFALTLVPHLVHQRFANADGRISRERFLGGHFGGRNAFGRLWWRAYLLHLPDDEEPFRLLRVLGEDQIVQILERPNISGYRPLARAVAMEWAKHALASSPAVRGEALMRDAMKRVRRLSAFVSWELLRDDELQAIVAAVFAQSKRALEGDREETRDDNATDGAHSKAFTPLPADLRAAERLEHWVKTSPLTEPKRSFIIEVARGLRTGDLPRIEGYGGLKRNSSYVKRMLKGLRNRGVRPEVLQRFFG